MSAHTPGPMEAFALLREELRAERAVKADLLAALGRIRSQLRDLPRTATTESLDKVAEAAIAKTTGAA
jgi:hypothetical protein